MINEEQNFKPTLSKPMSTQSKAFEKNFTKTMTANKVNLNETDGLLSEAEQSLKKKIFSLAKMEALVFSDPKLSSVYDEMSENGEEKYGYHYNETIMNMLFNDYVLNSPKYLQKYKQAIPKEKKRRDKSGINQLKKQGTEKMQTRNLDSKPESTLESTGSAGGAGGAMGDSSGQYSAPLGYEKQVDETTTSASSGAYVGPAAWGSGDLMKASGKSKVMRKPIWQGGTIIQESNYLVDASGFEKYVEALNEADRDGANNYIIDKTAAFTSDAVKGWNDKDTGVELDTINTGDPDKANLNTMEETKKISEKAKSPAQQRLFGMAHAVQKGELSPSKVGGAVKKIAKTVSPEDVEDFASTKHSEMNEEFGVSEYLVTVKHDNGVKTIKTTASSEDAAKKKIIASENCPESAITSVKQTKKIAEDAQSMIGDSPDTMANKPQPIGTQSSNMDMGARASGGMSEAFESASKLLEEINNELNAFSIHQDKLKKMAEDRKPSALVLRDRVGSENETNFKKDLQHSGTKEIIDVEKELQWKDQQSDVPKNPQELGEDLEDTEIKTTDAKSGEALKNVGDSANDKGDEIPKRNFTTKEQDEVNNYRLGQHSLVYDNEPGKRFEDRMKADMGDSVYEIRQKQMKFRSKAPMYNKDTQPVEDGKKDSVQFNKEQSGWNEREGLKESMITGRFVDALGKKFIMDFRLNEVKELKTPSDNLFELDFTGFGNKYHGRSVDNKVVVNENIDNVLSEGKYYTDGKEVFLIKNTKQNLSESVKKESKPVVNEQFEKMKHLLGYKPDTFTNTNNVKKNRGF